MATYYARKAGNINAADVWATTPSGTAAAVTFASGDVLVANSFTVTVNVSVSLGSAGQVRNDTFGGATNGGGFVLKPDQTLTATVITGTVNSCLTFADAGSTHVVGTINANATNVSTSGLVNNSSTGSVFITGNVVGSSGGANPTGITNSAGGVINVTGSVLGASGTGIRNSAGGTIIVTGPVEAGLGASSFGHGIFNAAAGTIQVVGNVTASSNLPAISSTSASSVVRVSGSFIYAVNGQVPIASNRVLLNTTPTLAFTRYAVNGTGTYFDMFTADNSLGQANPSDVRSGVSYANGSLTGKLTVPVRGTISYGVTYGPAMPFSATRSGTTATATLAYSYPYQVGDTFTVTGAFYSDWNGDYTVASVVSGTSITFSVPDTLPASTGAGAVLQTKGTAVLDGASVASAVWSAATSSLTTAGSIGERLKNAATVATTGDQLAAALTAP